MSFERTRPITLRMTDAAGVLFFAEQLALVHDVEEELFASLGFPVGEVLRARDFAFPIVHADTDYLAPLTVGDVVTVRLSVTRLGESAFTIRHVLTDAARSAVVGRGHITHVCIDRATKKKRALPDALSRALEDHVDDAPLSS